MEEDILRDALRKKIFNGSYLMNENLKDDTEFLFSTQYPTQVLNTDVGRYIRVNSADIHEDTIDDLVSLMLGIDQYTDDANSDIEFDPVKDIQHSIKQNGTYEGLDITQSDLIELDGFLNITNLDIMPVKPQLVALKSGKDEDSSTKDEIEEDKSGTGEGKSLTESIKALSDTLNPSKESAKQSKADIAYEAAKDLEQSISDLHDDDSIDRPFLSSDSMLDQEELESLKKLSNQLLKAFKGTRGKHKSTNPSKRTSAKDVAMDKDRVYITKRNSEGKFIKLNLLIDMSGSMSGKPLRNAVSIIWLFNQLAKEGHIKMSVFYSHSGARYKLTLPATDAEILATHRLGGSEGLTKTINIFKEDLANTNLICITDGQLADAPIKKAFWSKNRIIATGIYVNSAAKSPLEYSGTLSKWFNYSLVRQTLPEMVEWLVRTGIKG